MNRYVVLRELHDQHLPIGIAVETDDAVTIIALDEFGLPKRVTEPYRVLQRDLSTVEYVPGDPGYFEQVMLELQRVASLGASGSVSHVDRPSLIELYNDHVAKPRVAARRIYTESPSAVWTHRMIPTIGPVAQRDPDDRSQSRSRQRVAA